MAKRKLITKEFISKAIKKHGLLYDYSKVIYAGEHTKILIDCPIHGEFYQRPFNHIAGTGCPSAWRVV